MSANNTTNGAPRSRRAAAAAASQAINSQYNLPPVDQPSTPAPVAKRPRVDNGETKSTTAVVDLSVNNLPLKPLKSRASRKAVVTDNTQRNASENTIIVKRPANNRPSLSSVRLTKTPSPSSSHPGPAPVDPRPAKRVRVGPEPPSATNTPSATKTPPAANTPSAPSNHHDGPCRSSRATSRPAKYDFAGPKFDLSDEEDINDQDTKNDIFDAASDEGSDGRYSEGEYADGEEADETASPSGKTRADIVKFDKLVVDNNGLPRIGPQPQKEAPFVLAGSLEDMTRTLYVMVSGNLRITDRKLPNADVAELKTRGEELLVHLQGLLVPHGENRLKMVCDYTGMDMSQAPGSRSRSLEAYYHLSDRSGQIQYHALPNVGFISARLNWMKRDSTVLSLPLIALLLKAQRESDFHTRRGIMSWAYIALQNVNVLETVYHCRGSHKHRATQWMQWDKAKLKAMLEDGRTGKFSPTMREELKGWTRIQLLNGSQNQGSSTRDGWLRTRHSAAKNIHWETVYQWLQRVAGEYRLTPHEFEFYCTVTSPSGDRVFYPYHILSRPEAKESRYDWRTLHAMAGIALSRMRRNCNKWGEAAGLGEEKMDDLRLIVWWCHHLCSKIQAVKHEHSTATPEVIAFHICDRWGLPIVPWRGNALCASLCKLQDHGIAMKFGLVWPDGVEFDPVKHFDLDKCTVTIDTKATNMAMGNCEPHTWPGIRELVEGVPLSHPLWDIDPALGRESWVGEWHKAMPPPRTPVPPFRIPLLPIDAWLDGNATLQPLQCDECPGSPEFQTMGLLVRHYRTHHGGEAKNALLAAQDSPDAEKEELDAAFWSRHTCNWEGCNMTFTLASSLRAHLKNAHVDIQKKCPHCGKYRRYLDVHIKAVHSRAIPCPEAGCLDQFESAWKLNDHLGVKHDREVWRCVHKGCSGVFLTNSALKAHVRNIHKTEPFRCRKGCNSEFGSNSGRGDHEKKPHCPVDGCDKWFGLREDLDLHIESEHPEYIKT